MALRLEFCLVDCYNAPTNKKNATSYLGFISSKELLDYNDYSYNPSTQTTDFRGKYDVYLKLTMTQDNPDTNKMDFRCELKIRSLDLNTRLLYPYEVENISVTVNYYNNPLGTLDRNIQEEIDTVKSGWLVSFEWLDLLEQLLGFAKLICQIIARFREIVNLFAIITGKAAEACVSGLFPIACAWNQKSAVSTEKLNLLNINAWERGGGKFCKLLSCRMSADEWTTTTDSTGKKTNFMGNFMQKYAQGLGCSQTEAYSRKGYCGNVDPQHSLILSVVFLCLPGIIYNLQKARQIDCVYINCLKQTSQGMPIDLCVSQRSYGWCKFVWGELFNLIPFTAAISELLSNVRQALSDPLAFLNIGVGYLCKSQCTNPATAAANGCSICMYLEYASFAFDVLCDLGIGSGCEPVWDTLTVDNSACKEALQGEEDEE